MNLISASPTEDPVLQGVMLTHANLLYQLHNLKHFLQPQPKDASLSLLPPWHIYERSCGYFIYSCGMKQVCYAPDLSTIVNACTVGRTPHNLLDTLASPTPVSDALTLSELCASHRKASTKHKSWSPEQCSQVILMSTAGTGSCNMQGSGDAESHQPYCYRHCGKIHPNLLVVAQPRA